MKKESQINQCVLNLIVNPDVLNKIFNTLRLEVKYKIAKYNNHIKEMLNLNLNSYKEFIFKYTPIIVIIKPKYDITTKVINITDDNKNYIHIYNINKEEIKTNYVSYEEHNWIDKIVIDYQIDNFSCLFQNCIDLDFINFVYFKRNNIKNMSHMFDNCRSLDVIEFTEFNSENVTDMSFMFRNCLAADLVYLKNLNTSKVINMSHMFDNCMVSKYFQLHVFDTTNVKDMSFMFYNCNEIQFIDLNMFKTDNVETTVKMFSKCRNLKFLYLPNFNVNCNMANMFKNTYYELEIFLPNGEKIKARNIN